MISIFVCCKRVVSQYIVGSIQTQLNRLRGFLFERCNIDLSLCTHLLKLLFSEMFSDSLSIMSHCLRVCQMYVVVECLVWLQASYSYVTENNDANEPTTSFSRCLDAHCVCSTTNCYSLIGFLILRISSAIFCSCHISDTNDYINLVFADMK